MFSSLIGETWRTLQLPCILIYNVISNQHFHWMYWTKAPVFDYTQVVQFSVCSGSGLCHYTVTWTHTCVVWVIHGWLCCLSPDDGEEDPVGVQAHSPRQLAGASAVLHRRPAAGADGPAGVTLLLRLEMASCLPRASTGWLSDWLTDWPVPWENNSTFC